MKKSFGGLWVQWHGPVRVVTILLAFVLISWFLNGMITRVYGGQVLRGGIGLSLQRR